MRSGKSRYAQQLACDAEASGTRIAVLATALPGDDEMRARIERHRAERPAHWVTVETADLAGAVCVHAADDTLLLIDCLTVWISQMLAPPPGHPRLDDERALDALLHELARAPGRVIVVSNEIGLGVVPMDALSRAVVDALGRAHQRLAQLAQRVTWIVAGLPVKVKGDDR
jgi:adenosylcobinamide kinase / adenosylcobinamide-phosphate guanylyltransferase